ncbi:chymotrypsin-1-like [Armigeres subalbatus]|uniref:chymotrypsin-1-like n=1 Tax=Armigeres subalbatus TaxID=124917 RepID=UPI002ED2B329
MMKLSVTLLLACVALSSAASLKQELTKSVDRSGRIAGGGPARPDQIPYQVALLTAADGLHYCGGSILNRRWVLTAGACVIGKAPSDIIVFAGSNQLNERGQSRRVDRTVLHPNFDVELSHNDVAVVRVIESFVFNNFIQPINMSAEYAASGLNATVSGFGRESISNPGDGSLRFVQVQLISQETCHEAFDENYTPRLEDNTVCALGAEGEGICLGDAGGPLVYNGELIGVISWGVPCGLGLPDVFARVSAHRGWVLVHTLI